MGRAKLAGYSGGEERGSAFLEEGNGVLGRQSQRIELPGLLRYMGNDFALLVRGRQWQFNFAETLPVEPQAIPNNAVRSSRALRAKHVCPE